NASRCKKCGATFLVTDAWTSVMGRPPSRAQVDALGHHAKFGQLCTFDFDRLVAAGRDAVEGDGIDVDVWVGAAMHRALAGPPHERGRGDFGSGFHPATRAGGRPGAGQAVRRDMRLALVLALALVSIVVVLLVMNNGGSSRRPSNGQTAVVQRNGDGHSNSD